jgi:hypothetical protein
MYRLVLASSSSAPRASWISRPLWSVSLAHAARPSSSAVRSPLSPAEPSDGDADETDEAAFKVLPRTFSEAISSSVRSSSGLQRFARRSGESDDYEDDVVDVDKIFENEVREFSGRVSESAELPMGLEFTERVEDQLDENPDHALPTPQVEASLAESARVTEFTTKRVAELDAEAEKIPEDEWPAMHEKYWDMIGAPDPLRRPDGSLAKRAGGSPDRVVLWNKPKPVVRPVPEPRAPFDTVEKFMRRIGRGCEDHISSFDSWDALFTSDSRKLKGFGIKPPQRKWILKWVERYRQGVDPMTHQNNIYYNRF